MSSFVERFAKKSNAPQSTNSAADSEESSSFAQRTAPKASFTEQRLNDDIHLIRGDNQGKKAWYYLKITDKAKLQLFLRDVKKPSIDLANYGDIIECGWGEDPPKELTDKYGS